MTPKTMQAFAEGLTGPGSDAGAAAIKSITAHSGPQAMEEYDALILLLTTQRNALAATLGQPAKAEPLLQLATEMQAVICAAWNRWDKYDQEDSPGLGDRLEKYAGLSLPQAGNSCTLLDQVVQSWDVAKGTRNPVPGEHSYNIIAAFNPADHALLVQMVPAGISSEDPDSLAAKPQLQVLFEVNGGIPSAHVYGDIHGDVAATLHGKPGARLGLRPGDASIDHEPMDYLPDPQLIANELAEQSSRATQETPRD